MAAIPAAMPPNGLTRPRDDLIGRKVTIAFRVPFGGEIGPFRAQRRRARDASSGAERTAAFVGYPHSHGCTPHVIGPARAAPPRKPRRARDDLPRSDPPVPRGMPLTRDPGRNRRERVAAANSLTSAERAAVPVPSPRVHNRAPNVILARRTTPPHGPARASDDLLRPQLAVALRVPLGRDRGEQRCERVRDRYASAGAEGTAAALFGADPCLRRPNVIHSARASPPDTLRRPGGHGVGEEIYVLGRVPLGDEVFVSRDPMLGGAYREPFPAR